MGPDAWQAGCEPVPISPIEYGRRMGLSLPTVRRYIKAGRIPVIQPGGKRCRVLIPVSALHSQSASAIETVEVPPEEPQRSPDVPDPRATRPSGPTPQWLKRRETK